LAIKLSRLALILALTLIHVSATVDAAEGKLSEEELQELEASLRATELAFAASVADQDRGAFAGFIADEAIFVAATVLQGKQAVLDGWAVFFGDGAPKLVWKPELVVIQDDGALGMTRGPFAVEQPGPDGTVMSQSGLFTSVWEHQADGGWKVIFDAGCPPCQSPQPVGEPD
jgi:ketosteroid isomerase-like protein